MYIARSIKEDIQFTKLSDVTLCNRFDKNKTLMWPKCLNENEDFFK